SSAGMSTSAGCNILRVLGSSWQPSGRRIIMRRLFLVSAACIALNAAAQSPAEKLAAHTDEFRKEVIEVTDGVHVAVGYALANSILIEGDDAVIIVDVTESPAAAQEIKAEFEKITDKPVAAIIYTHNHTDHIMGAKVFAGDDAP